MSPRGSASLGGSAFGYQQQQQLEQAQQHLRVQRLVQQQQQAQRQPQQDPFGALWDLRGGSEGGTLGGGGGGGASAGTVGDTGGGASLGGGHGQGHGHGHGHAREGRSASASGHEVSLCLHLLFSVLVGANHHFPQPINFLSLLHPASSPPYAAFVARIIKSADQQASIFLQQKLKVAGSEERARIVDAICARGGEMMMHRFGNWAVQRCLEAATGPEERRKIVACMRGRIVDLATNCYGCHVLQKALDCEEEEVRLLIVSELLMGDPAQTLVNKHASHVWSKIMELSWTPPAPPIFAYVNKSLKGKWAALACHETGSLVVQHAFENLEETAKDGIVDELLGQGITVFGEVAKSQWGSYCIQHILEHGSEKHRQMALEHLLTGLLEFATNEQGSKSVVKALKEGGKETLDRVVGRMCEPAKGARRAMIVDLALSLTGSQLIASVLPTADKDQRALLYDCIRGHIVTLRGCKTGSKVIWLFDRMRAYYGY
ncbi:armadillo-type protein [Favolaschia claudopus]|uniref:Armadillo-type protein n=1 Tax=Favolaschia claudopus TaxID=2862362 RepID=A0AAW0A8Y9_9AGAR